jgi:hypothetical protein
MSIPTPIEIIRTPAPAKRYFARVSGSRFVCPHCGVEYTFFFGKIDVEIEECQEQLDWVVRTGNPMIYTQDVIPEEVKEVEIQIKDAQDTGKSEAEVAGADAVLKNAGVHGRVQQEVGRIDAGAGLPSSVEKSSIDIKAQAEFMKIAKPGTLISGPTMTKVHR